MGGVRKWLAMWVVAALIFGCVPQGSGLLYAAEKTNAAKYSEFLLVKPGAFSGKVLYTDGKTPATQVPVRVWNIAQKKFVQTAATDENGAYKLPELAPGRYFVVFGDRVCVDLRVDEKAKLAPQPLNVVIPKGKAYAAPEPEAMERVVVAGGEGAEGSSTLLKGGIIVGAAGATAIGIAAGTGNLDFNHSRHTSP